MMTVIVPYGLNGDKRTITISSRCPKCGGPRGEPLLYKGVHTWENPCGHVDLYYSMIKEANMNMGNAVQTMEWLIEQLSGSEYITPEIESAVATLRDFVRGQGQ